MKPEWLLLGAIAAGLYLYMKSPSRAALIPTGVTGGNVYAGDVTGDVSGWFNQGNQPYTLTDQYGNPIPGVT